jgi:hypothetical protein
MRIYNRDGSGRQVSFSLQRWQQKTSPRLRRGVVMTPVLIPAGLYYDVCKELGVSFEEAKALCERSPELKAHERAGRLLVREHPPMDETLAKEAEDAAAASAAAAKTAALNPPDPPNAIPAGVDPEAAGLPADTPRMTRAPADKPPEPEPAPVSELPSFDAPDADADADADETTDPGRPAAPEPEEDPTDTPSMDWDLDRLVAFAEANEIDLGRSTSKTSILKKIRRAMES